MNEECMEFSVYSTGAKRWAGTHAETRAYLRPVEPKEEIRHSCSLSGRDDAVSGVMKVRLGSYASNGQVESEARNSIALANMKMRPAIYKPPVW